MGERTRTLVMARRLNRIGQTCGTCLRARFTLARRVSEGKPTKRRPRLRLGLLPAGAASKLIVQRCVVQLRTTKSFNRNAIGVRAPGSSGDVDERGSLAEDAQPVGLAVKHS